MSESTNDQDDSPLLFGCIKIGQSYNVKLLFPFTQTNDDNSLISLHYKFKPQGINPNIPGKILLKEAGDVDILLANQDNKEERFHGVCNESNTSNEFILSFTPPTTTTSDSSNINSALLMNGDNNAALQSINDNSPSPSNPMFTLQQVDTCVRQLRHIRDEEKFNEKATTHTSNTIKKKQTEQLNKLTSTTTNTTISTKKRSHSTASGHNSEDGPKAKKKRCIEAVKNMLTTRLKWS